MEVLNEDILGIIISKLDIEDILNLNCVDKRIYNIIKEDIKKKIIKEPHTDVIIIQYNNVTLYKIIKRYFNEIFIYRLKTNKDEFVDYQYYYHYMGTKLVKYRKFIGNYLFVFDMNDCIKSLIQKYKI